MVLIDQADHVRIVNCRWWAEPHKKNGKRYIYVRGKVPKTGGGYRTMYLHRFLLGAQREEMVWHKNGNGLDNRRRNLYLTSRRGVLQATDADIEAGELESEISERLEAISPRRG